MGVINYVDHQYAYLKRYNQIIKVLFKYGFEDLVSYLEENKRFRFLKKLVPRNTLEQSLQLTKWQKMRLVCEELGPSFVKFGQIMSNRPDLLPPELITELEKLQDSVPPFPGQEAVNLIEKQFGDKISGVFASFDQNALASASVAQVHRATLKTGEQVVVKIQRPGIKQIIESDIRVMRYMAELMLKRIPSIKNFDPLGLIANFEESIAKELDFIHESVNVQRFSANFKGDTSPLTYVRSPNVYPDYTTENILTLEWIDGVKISDLDKLRTNGYDHKLLASRLATSFLRQIFDHGFFHADPHSGNLFVLPENVLCYIDFGMMGSIMKKDLEQLSTLFLSIYTKDVKRIIRSLQSFSEDTSVTSFRELETDLNEFVNNYAIRDIHKNEFSTVLLELKDIIIKHELKVPAHFFLLAKAMVSIEGIIHHLDPTLDLTVVIRPYFLKTISRNYNPLKFAKRVLTSAYEMGLYMEEFPRDLKNAMKKINTGEIKVELNHKGIDPLTRTLNRVSRQVVSAVIISAIIIGSSLLIVARIPPQWHNTSIWGIVGFAVVLILGIGLLKDINKRDDD